MQYLKKYYNFLSSLFTNKLKKETLPENDMNTNYSSDFVSLVEINEGSTILDYLLFFELNIFAFFRLKTSI